MASLCWARKFNKGYSILSMATFTLVTCRHLSLRVANYQLKLNILGAAWHKDLECSFL